MDPVRLGHVWLACLSAEPARGCVVFNRLATDIRRRRGQRPSCREQARRVHNLYQSSLDERSLGSRRVVIRLRVSRYFCDRKSGGVS